MSYGIGSAISSNMTNTVTEVIIPSVNPDIATGQEETFYQNTKWSQQYGTFLKIANLQSALHQQSTWTVGKGYDCDPETKVILDHITGFGKESFHEIIFNQNLVAHLAGDSYAEIIRDVETDTLLNLKPIDPATMKVVFDSKGIIKRYEQTSNTGKAIVTFKPNEILHLANKKFGASTHGISELEAMQGIIDAENESNVDLRKIMHRQARPLLIFKLGTDDPTKINAFKNLVDGIVQNGENLYLPNDANTLDIQVVQGNISPVVLAYREQLKSMFLMALGLPVSIFGGASGSESSSKISYLAHETVFAKNSLFLEQQIWNQLYLKVKFISPATLLDNLQQDQSKDGPQGMEIQPSDVTAGSGN